MVDCSYMPPMMQLISLTFALFLLMDSIGNIPLFLSFLKGVPAKRQKKIILRELIIALGIIVLFYFVGDVLLELLNIEQSTLLVAGGIILFLISLRMIFPEKTTPETAKSSDKEPFIVPLAIPFVAGPAVLAAVMLYSHQDYSPFITVTAIVMAWGLSLAVLMSSYFLVKKLGEKGLLACERLMGLLLVLISVQMFLEGLSLFSTTHRG